MKNFFRKMFTTFLAGFIIVGFFTQSTVAESKNYQNGIIPSGQTYMLRNHLNPTYVLDFAEGENDNVSLAQNTFQFTHGWTFVEHSLEKNVYSIHPFGRPELALKTSGSNFGHEVYVDYFDSENIFSYWLVEESGIFGFQNLANMGVTERSLGLFTQIPFAGNIPYLEPASSIRDSQRWNIINTGW